MILIIVSLILTSGFFSLFEEALQSVRKPRLHKEINDAEARAAGRKQPARYRRKARRFRQVLNAAENPAPYFAAVHFWIIGVRTFAAVLAGLIVEHLPLLQSPESRDAPLPVFMTALICAAVFVPTMLLLSSLFPRIIARRAPETIAAALLPIIKICALPLKPAYALTRLIAGRLKPAFAGTEQPGMTEDELRLALVEGEKSGIVESKEKTMVEGVFYLGDRPLGAFMTHRSDIQWLDIRARPEEVRVKVLKYREQRCFPVAYGTLDAIIGAAYAEDIILTFASNSPGGLRAAVKKAVFVPETMPALKAFESFKQGKADFLFVMDEYGGFAGMVGVQDLIEEIVGELAAPVREEKQAVPQEDGSWLAAGGLNIDDAAELFSLPGLAAAKADYHTLAGFVLSLAGELPRPGDSFVYSDCIFTVVEMDGNRIEKIAIKLGSGECSS